MHRLIGLPITWMTHTQTQPWGVDAQQPSSSSSASASSLHPSSQQATSVQSDGPAALVLQTNPGGPSPHHPS